MIKYILSGTIIGVMAVVIVLNIRAMNKMVRRNRGLRRVIEKQERTIESLKAIQNPYSFPEDGLIVLNDKDRIEKVIVKDHVREEQLEKEIRQLQLIIDMKNRVIENRDKWLDSISKYLEKNNIVIKDIIGEEDEK